MTGEITAEGNFTEGKIFGPLIKFAGPILLAMFLQVMYGAVDLLVVGKFAETADVSAVSTGSQLMQSITTALVGLSMGTTVLLGQYLGEGKKSKAGKVIGGGIVLFLIIGGVLTIAIPVFAGALSDLMKAPEEAYTRTVSYITICGAGSLFIVAYNLLGSIFRGIGDSKTPLLSVAIACVANIAGDLILVAIFGMGSAGAAIATVGAQGVSVAVCYIILKHRNLPFTLKKKDIYFNTEVIKNTITLGLPLALQDFLVGISFLVILAIVNSLGVVVSAGVGVAEKVCGFVLLMPISMSNAVTAFVAQNFGAGKLDRAEKGLKYAIAMSFTMGLAIFYFAFFRGNILASIFTNSEDVVLAAADYLKAYAFDTLLTSFMFCFNGYFSGCGKTKFVMFHGIFSAFCIRIPVSYFMSKIVPVRLFYIGLATPASTLVQCILCFVYFHMLKKKNKS